MLFYCLAGTVLLFYAGSSSVIYLGRNSDVLFYERYVYNILREEHVIVIDLFSETVLFNHRGGRSPPRLLDSRVERSITVL